MQFRTLSVIAAFLISIGSLLAQEPSAPAGNASPSTSPASFDPAAATQQWLDSIPAREKARSDAYFEGGYWLILWNALVTAVIMLLLLATKFSARIRDWAERVTRFKAIQIAIYAILFLVATTVLGFPLHYYENFLREHQYGMANQNFPSWFAEQLKALLIQLIVTPLFLMALYAVFRRAPQRWWIIGTIVVMFFFIVGAIIAPIYIEPVFNKYTELTDAKIRDPILQLARANQIPVNKVFVVDASRQTKRVSANVAGFLGTTRIALNDNLLKQCTLPEIRTVMGHEMGHYVLNHILKFFVELTLLVLIAFGLTKIFFDAAVKRWGVKWGVRGIGDPAGWPLLVLILTILGFLGTPVLNTITRTQEREADIFGLNTAREPDGEAMIDLKLGKYRKMDPGHWEEIIFFDHPSGRSRIRQAMDWKAAHLPDGTYQHNASGVP